MKNTEPTLNYFLLRLYETEEMTTIAPSTVVQCKESKNNSSKFKKLAVNTFQQIQIEKFRLNFLLRCREVKRPTPTLRCTGFRALDESDRIKIISEIETTVLLKAIDKKKKEIKGLEL